MLIDDSHQVLVWWWRDNMQTVVLFVLFLVDDFFPRHFAIYQSIIILMKRSNGNRKHAQQKGLWLLRFYALHAVLYSNERPHNVRLRFCGLINHSFVNTTTNKFKLFLWNFIHFPSTQNYEKTHFQQINLQFPKQK